MKANSKDLFRLLFFVSTGARPFQLTTPAVRRPTSSSTSITTTPLLSWQTTAMIRCARRPIEVHLRSFSSSLPASTSVDPFGAASAECDDPTTAPSPVVVVGPTLLAASRIGLDPSQNRFHGPIVYHERYSFDGWPESHTFPVG